MKQKDFSHIIHKISFAGKERLNLFLVLEDDQKAQVLYHLSKHIQFDLMTLLSDKKLVDILSFLDPDEITDLVQILPERRKKRIIKKFRQDLQQSVEILNQFDPKTAAGLMNLDYIQVDADDKISDVAKQFKVHEKRTGRLPVIFVLDGGDLMGYLPGHELGFSKPSEKTRKHVRKIFTIHHNASHEEVIDLFRLHPHNKICVLGDRNNILGVVYSDDVLQSLKEEETAALYDFAGVHDEEGVLDSARSKIKNRYKWLLINLGTAFLASFVVGLFDDVISKYVLLAVYMPIVAGMGGNAATQTLAIMVRGIALKQIDLKTAWPTIKRELISGFVNGLLNGLVVASVVLLFNNDLKIALILSMAMIINLLVAGFFGTIVPLIMQKLGKDPATSATIFITTATDVLGFLAFLGLATVILN